MYHLNLYYILSAPRGFLREIFSLLFGVDIWTRKGWESILFNCDLRNAFRKMDFQVLRSMPTMQIHKSRSNQLYVYTMRIAAGNTNISRKLPGNSNETETRFLFPSFLPRTLSVSRKEIGWLETFDHFFFSGKMEKKIKIEMRDFSVFSLCIEIYVSCFYRFSLYSEDKMEN